MHDRTDRPTGGALLRTIAAGLLLALGWVIAHGLIGSLAERYLWTR
jgi:hypothetical protein